MIDGDAKFYLFGGHGELGSTELTFFEIALYIVEFSYFIFNRCPSDWDTNLFECPNFQRILVYRYSGRQGDNKTVPDFLLLQFISIQKKRKWEYPFVDPSSENESA